MRKLKIIFLITMGIFFTLIPIFSIDLMENFNIYSVDRGLINLDNENLKLSKISGKIHIDNNWTAAKDAGICNGEGFYSNPYVIEDLVIDGKNSGSCILIENSDVFFKIENCTVYNSGLMGQHAGIKLYNVNKSHLVNNSFISNRRGLSLSYSNNNTVTGNKATNNLDNGIALYFSDNNIIANNSCSGGRFGISLHLCKNITISKNKMNDCGLDLYGYLSLNSINVDTTNLVNGKIVYYYNNKINLGSDNFTNAGQVILYDCHESSIENLNTSYGSTGISLDHCNNNNITRNIVIYNKNSGIDLSESYNNNIWENTIDYNTYNGIDLYHSYNNIISKNNASYNYSGVTTQQCASNNISGNTFNANRLDGIYLYDSNYNNISANTLNTNKRYGAFIYYSNNNLLSGNTANYNSNAGIFLLSSDYNNISGNFLVGNGKCVKEEDCEGNIFENNYCSEKFPFELIIVIAIISGGAVIGVATLLLIKRNRKRIEF